MKNKSIDDIFEGIDLNDEELLKEAEEVDNFKVDDVNQLKDSKNIISAEYFYDFDGWYTAPTGGAKVVSFGTVTGNVSYY